MNNSFYILTNQLSELEMRVVKSVLSHIERDSGRVGIRNIAQENFVSTSFIMKLCKRLGFDGYSDLYYNLSQRINEFSYQPRLQAMQSFVDNYDEERITDFCNLLHLFRDRKLFVVGAGFADLIADYIVQRLAICGFMVFNRVHFYDFMLFRSDSSSMMHTNIEPALIIAISQSGESEVVLNDVNKAISQGYKVASFTKRADSTLANLSDVPFLVDSAKQTLVGGVPNHFFAKVIMAFEELLGIYMFSHSPKEN